VRRLDPRRRVQTSAAPCRLKPTRGEIRKEVLLVNARMIKHVPGRKTNVADCQWIARLLQHGLLKGSFIPPRWQPELRGLSRQPAQLTEERSRTSNRIQKVLVPTAISTLMKQVHRQMCPPTPSTVKSREHGSLKGRCWFGVCFDLIRSSAGGRAAAEAVVDGLSALEARFYGVPVLDG
jgi:Transposase